MSAVPEQTIDGKLVDYDPDMLDHLLTWKDESPKLAKKVVRLIEHTILTPGEGPGRPKKLGNLPNVWSRRITRHHRLIYLIDGDTLRFISCYGHDVPGALRDEATNGPKEIR